MRSRLDRINAVYLGKAEAVAEVLLQAEREVLTGSRHGRIYNIPHTSFRYVASYPGEPPAQRTGVLRFMWTKLVTISKSIINGRIVLTPTIETDVPYARWLEEGTINMDPRPFANRVKERAKTGIRRIMGS